MSGETLDFWSRIVLPIGTFILGCLISRFTMSKAERKAHYFELQKLSNELLVAKDNKFKEFVEAMRDYADKKPPPDLNDFCNIAQKGEAYFASLTTLCDSILSGNIAESTVINTHAQTISEAVNKSLPSFYAALQKIATQRGINYTGKLDRKNYQSIFKVYDKFKDRITI